MTTVNVVTYNMGMGAKRIDRPFFASKEVAFDIFAERLGALCASGTWFVCMQEVDRAPELLAELRRRTGNEWFLECFSWVAIFSTVAPQKVLRWDLGHDRVALAMQTPLGWVVTAHLLSAPLDPSNRVRIRETETILQHMVLFDAHAPILFAADMNVAEGIEVALFAQTIGKMERFGFTRAANSEFTIKSWASEGAIVDYLLVSGCAPGPVTVLNFQRDGLYASDHKGLSMAVEMP